MAGRDRKRQVQRERYERKRAEMAVKRARARRRNTILSAVLAVLVVGGIVAWIVIGVGGGGTSTAANETPSPSASDTPSPSPAPTYAPGCTSKPPVAATPKPNFPILPADADAALRTPPTVTIPAGPVPTKLTTKDIVEGKGETVKEGDAVTVNYVGLNYVDCSVFDSSWSRQEFADFTLDESVIPGFSKGLVGMKVGGRREVVVPPEDGYGAAGSGAVKPNEEIVFVVDMIAASHPSSAPSPSAAPSSEPQPSPSGS